MCERPAVIHRRRSTLMDGYVCSCSCPNTKHQHLPYGLVLVPHLQWSATRMNPSKYLLCTTKVGVPARLPWLHPAHRPDSRPGLMDRRVAVSGAPRGASHRIASAPIPLQSQTRTAISHTQNRFLLSFFPQDCQTGASKKQSWRALTRRVGTKKKTNSVPPAHGRCLSLLTCPIQPAAPGWVPGGLSQVIWLLLVFFFFFSASNLFLARFIFPVFVDLGRFCRDRSSQPQAVLPRHLILIMLDVSQAVVSQVPGVRRR